MPFIDDGYSDFTVTIPPFGERPAIRVNYRPAMDPEVREFQAKCRISAEEETKAVQALLTSHLTAWDITDRGGTPRPIKESLERVFARESYLLRNREIEKMVTAVTGWSDAEKAAAAKNSPLASGSTS